VQKNALLSQFGGKAQVSLEVNADHQGIVRNAALLSHLRAAMRDAQARARARETADGRRAPMMASER